MRKRSKLLCVSVALPLARQSPCSHLLVTPARTSVDCSPAQRELTARVTLVEGAPLCELRLLYLTPWKLWVACKLLFWCETWLRVSTERRVANRLCLWEQVGRLLQFLSSSLSYLSLPLSPPTLPRTYFVFPSPDRILRIARAITSPRSRIANSVGFGHKVSPTV